MVEEQAEIEPVIEEQVAEVEAPEPEQVEDEITITIEGMDPEPEQEEAPTNAVRQLREALKDRERQLRELKAKMPTEAAQEPKADPRPELRDHQWDEAAHADAVVAWAEREATRKAEAKAQQSRGLERQHRFEEKQAKARSTGKTLSRDFETIESNFRDALSDNHLAVIYHTVPDAAQMICAIAGNKKLMEYFAKENDITAFAVHVGELKGKIKVERKAPPAPEARINGGSGSPIAISQARIDAAEKLAEKTGDRSEVIRLKKLMRG
jgi:hypothetical protein